MGSFSPVMSKRPTNKLSKFEPISDLSFKQLKERIEKVISRLDALLRRVREKTELAVFLTTITEDFTFDLVTSSEDLKHITVEDKLDALEESERGKLLAAFLNPFLNPF